MKKFSFILFLTFIYHLNKKGVNAQEEDNENNVGYTIFNDELPTEVFSTGVVWDKKTNFSEKCACSANRTDTVITFIIHGWYSSERSWITELKDKYFQYRGGCIIVVNWGHYSCKL